MEEMIKSLDRLTAFLNRLAGMIGLPGRGDVVRTHIGSQTQKPAQGGFEAAGARSEVGHPDSLSAMNADLAMVLRDLNAAFERKRREVQRD